MRDHNSASDSVTSVVTSNVTTPNKPTAQKSIAKPKRQSENIRHVTGTRYGWTYQRRFPRDLDFAASDIIFKKRLGARSKSEVRRLATAFDMLLDGVFGVVKIWKVRMMTIVDDLGLEPWQKDYIIHRMRVGVEQGVREIAKNGYKTPGLESQIITKAIDNIDKDLLELSQCKALSRQHQTVDMVSKLKARKLDIIWKNEMNKLDCELGVNLGHGQTDLPEKEDNPALGCAVYNSIVALNELEDFDPKVVEFLENRETKKQKNVTQSEINASIAPPTCAASEPKEKYSFWVLRTVRQLIAPNHRLLNFRSMQD